jgi:hypothetical protein
MTSTVAGQQNTKTISSSSSHGSNTTISNIGRHNTSTPAGRPNTSTNLMQLLNDPTLKQKQKQKGPTLGHTSLVGGMSNTSTKAVSSSGGSSSKSSNSQLFKSHSGDTSSSSAIPLTFNNSIAEVLAAAAKSKSRNQAATASGGHGAANAATSKAEVTITPKSSVNQQHKSSSAVISLAGPSSSMMGQHQQLQSLLYANSSISAKPQTTLSSVSIPSIIASNHPNKEHSSAAGKSKSAMKTNPLLDMSKLLHNQPIGIAPHMVAQNTLSIPTTLAAVGNASISAVTQVPKPVLSTHQLAGTMPKIAPKPSSLSSILKPVPVAVSKPSGIQTVNKKSLNTVLDRLSGLKSISSSVGGISSSGSNQSSLVQQLQAPPMMTNPGLQTSPTKQSRNNAAAAAASVSSAAAASATSTLSSMQQQSSSAAAANNAAMQQALLASQLGMGFPGASGAAVSSSLVGQPMVQFPWGATSTAAQTAHGNAAQQQAALAEAQRALTMAGAGLPGMNQAAALAALQELMKINLQAQQVKTSGQRLRAPPPLTHMGRPGGSNNPNNPKQPKNPE